VITSEHHSDRPDLYGEISVRRETLKIVILVEASRLAPSPRGSQVAREIRDVASAFLGTRRRSYSRNRCLSDVCYAARNWIELLCSGYRIVSQQIVRTPIVPRGDIGYGFIPKRIVSDDRFSNIRTVKPLRRCRNILTSLKRNTFIGFNGSIGKRKANT